MKRWIAVAALGIAVVAGMFAVAQTASAAKPEPFIIEVDCGEDGIYDVALNSGRGRYTPAFIVGGGVFIPIAFSNQHGTFTDNEGHTETFDEPDSSKGGPPNKDFLNCHFEIEFEDENGSGSFEGDVKGFIAGR